MLMSSVPYGLVQKRGVLSELIQHLYGHTEENMYVMVTENILMFDVIYKLDYVSNVMRIGQTVMKS